MSPMSKPIILSLATAMSNVVAANAGDCRHVGSQDNQKSWDYKTAPADAHIWKQVAQNPAAVLSFGAGVIACFRALTKRADTKANRTKDL
jgi:hypothetical protein